MLCYLKEYKILDYALLGIRQEESSKRKKLYKEIEQCRVYKKNEKSLQYFPILYWTLSDVREFILQEKINLHPKYYDAYGNLDVEKRLGCIGCPLASKKRRLEEFKKYPKIAKLYIKKSQFFLDTHPNSQIHNYFKDGYDFFLFSLCFDYLKDFKDTLSNFNLFGEGLEPKKILENLLNIDL